MIMRSGLFTTRWPGMDMCRFVLNGALLLEKQMNMMRFIWDSKRELRFVIQRQECMTERESFWNVQSAGEIFIKSGMILPRIIRQTVKTSVHFINRMQTGRKKQRRIRDREQIKV